VAVTAAHLRHLAILHYINSLDNNNNNNNNNNVNLYVMHNEA